MRELLTATLLLLVAGGQAQKPAIGNSVLGRWTATRPRAAATDPRVTVTFARDRFTAQMTGLQRGKRVTVTATGAYAIQAGRMSSRITDAKLDPASFTPAKRKKMFTPEATARFRQMIIRSGGPEGALKFLSKDRFELKTASGNVTTFTRIR